MTLEIPKKYSAEEWEHFRTRFSESILKTTEIAELGRSVGISWPFKGSGETPEKYIKFSFEELQSVPGLIGKKKRVNDLMDVLREILAFDDPFSDMMDTVEEKSNDDRIYERILKKLEIPENYPVNLMFFSPDAKELLHTNGIKTLIEAINLGKSSSKKLESDNDLHSLINGLALINEATIRKHLPFRIGQRGLHLPEAIGLLVRSMDEPVRIDLLRQAGIPLTDSENSSEETIEHKPSETSLKVISVRFNELCSWFGTQTDELTRFCDSPESIERYFLPINDAVIERVSIALAMIHFAPSLKAKSSIFKKVSNLFKR
jgi:hypothetical protein